MCVCVSVHLTMRVCMGFCVEGMTVRVVPCIRISVLHVTSIQQLKSTSEVQRESETHD